MTLVERLRGDFARVIDAHQPGGVLFLPGVEFSIFDVSRWITPYGKARRSDNRTQSVIGTDQNFVDRAYAAFKHVLKYSARPPPDGILRGRFSRGTGPKQGVYE